MPPLAVAYPLALLALASAWWVRTWWQLHREHRDAAAQVIEGRDVDKCAPVGPEPVVRKAGPYTIVIDREHECALE